MQCKTEMRKRNKNHLDTPRGLSKLSVDLSFDRHIKAKRPFEATCRSKLSVDVPVVTELLREIGGWQLFSEVKAQHPL